MAKTKEQMKEYKRTWRLENIDHLRAYEKKRHKTTKRKLRVKLYYYNNRDVVISRIRLRKYGISLEDYNSLFTKQHGVCAICLCPETRVDIRTGRIMALSVDHCHTTGKVRGLLCFKCNGILGWAKDNPVILNRAAAYLE